MENKKEIVKVTYSEISDAIYHLIKDTALRSMKLLKGLMEMNGLEELCGSMETASNYKNGGRNNIKWQRKKKT